MGRKPRHSALPLRNRLDHFAGDRARDEVLVVGRHGGRSFLRVDEHIARGRSAFTVTGTTPTTSAGTCAADRPRYRRCSRPEETTSDELYSVAALRVSRL